MQFVDAVRENVGLLIGLAGGTGSGKTYSGLRLASGIARGKPFAFIDTENKRGLHYADQFHFKHGDMRPPFSPEAYAKAIMAADAAGYPVIVVDSMSHEWAGEGGVLEMQEKELDRLGGGDRVKMLSWAKPKGDHKKMVQRMLQVRAHLILCFRAEEKVEMSKDGNGKTVVMAKKGLTGLDGWFPICEKNLPFELTTSFLLTAQRPGVPLPIKLQQQHRALFPLDQPITEDSGRAIAEWAAGGVAVPKAPANADTPAKALAKRWGRHNHKQSNETPEAYRARFLSWACLKGEVTITDPAQLTDDALFKCNAVLNDIESAASSAA